MAVDASEREHEQGEIENLRSVQIIGPDGEITTYHSIRKFTELISPEDDPYRADYIRQCARGDNNRGKDLRRYTVKLEHTLYIQDEARKHFKKKGESSQQPELNLD